MNDPCVEKRVSQTQRAMNELRESVERVEKVFQDVHRQLDSIAQDPGPDCEPAQTPKPPEEKLWTQIDAQTARLDVVSALAEEFLRRLEL